MVIAHAPNDGNDGVGIALTNLKDGNASHTQNFVREHIGWMLAVAFRILKDTELSEDAVQNAFVNIFKSLEKFEGRSQLKTWMHRIVVNESLMLLRKRKRLHEISIEEHLPEFDERGCRIEDPWTKIETPEALLQQSQVKEKISELIDALPDIYRIVLTLRDIEEMSTMEVAELLDMSETNVKVRLHRARAALKKLLEPLMRGEEL
ncbi:MAG: sigma-70 family RNA polymerase sigma factor [Rhizobiaceae bacterium]